MSEAPVLLEAGEVASPCAGVLTHALRWRCGRVRPGEPPVVLLHGFSQSAHTWASVGPRLARALPGRDVWAPEFAGHGESEHAHEPEPYALEALVRSLDAFAADVVLRDSPCGRVDLVGYSMGGRVASLYALAHVRRVSRLVLESAGLGPADDAAREAARVRDARVAGLLRSEPLGRFMDFWEALPVFASQRRLAAQDRSRLRAARMDNDPECLALTVEGSGQHAMPRVLEDLANLGVPTLYLAGALDAKYAALARAFGEACPRACVRVLAGAGHDVHFEDEDAFCAHVGEFLGARDRKDTQA